MEVKRSIMAHVELSLDLRRRIERLNHASVPVSEIELQLGRHRSTIYRDLARNRFTYEENPYLDGYHGMAAHGMAARRRHRRRKFVQMPALRAAIVNRLRVSWNLSRSQAACVEMAAPRMSATRRSTLGSAGRTRATGVRALPVATAQEALRVLRPQTPCRRVPLRAGRSTAGSRPLRAARSSATGRPI